jgi:hypothetical protein
MFNFQLFIGFYLLEKNKLKKRKTLWRRFSAQLLHTQRWRHGRIIVSRKLAMQMIQSALFSSFSSARNDWAALWALSGGGSLFSIP